MRRSARGNVPRQCDPSWPSCDLLAGGYAPAKQQQFFRDAHRMQVGGVATRHCRSIERCAVRASELRWTGALDGYYRHARALFMHAETRHDPQSSVTRDGEPAIERFERFLIGQLAPDQAWGDLNVLRHI